MRSAQILVVMPMFNAEPFLNAAVDSILSQSWADFKFLIIDDGSKDGSAEIIRSYRDQRIILWEQPNSGPGAAMNRGLQYAVNQQIPFIARMDADDISMPQRLEKQIHILQKNTLAAACSANCFWMDSTTEKLIGTSTVSTHSKLIRWEIFHGLRGLIQGACVFRSEALHSVGGYRSSFRLSEETDLFLRLAEVYPLTNSKEFLYKIRVNSNSLSMMDVHKNTLNQFYALDCSKRRRSGMPERDFSHFISGLNWQDRYRIWREEKMLDLWRSGFSKGGVIPKLFAAVVDPRRLLVRILREFNKPTH